MLKGGIPRSRVSPSPGWAASSSDWSENWDDFGDDLPERNGSGDRERDRDRDLARENLITEISIFNLV